MARSTYIYIVFRDGCLSSAFTVKHEMIDSLPKSFEKFNDFYKIYRVRDIAGVAPEIIDITTQIGGEAYEECNN